MISLRELFAKLGDWTRRDRLDRELAEELRFHREHLERDAGAEAARRLGNVTRVREDAREIWSIPWLDHLQQDVRYALRGLLRSPGFTITVMLTLGLGIGANAAMFGLIDRLMLRPFPYLREPAAVHRVYLQSTERGETITRRGMEYTRYLDLAKWTTSFSAMAGFSSGTMAVGTGAESRERHVARVSAAFFGFFDMRPALGRFFVAAEDTTPRGADVVVLSHGYWSAEYGRRRDVLGEVIRIGSIPATIIGVAAEGFVGVSENEPPAMFIPITTYAGYSQAQRDPTSYYLKYNWGWMNVMARRKPGVSVADASADLGAAHWRSWNAALAMVDDDPPPEVAKPRALAGPLKTAAGPTAGLETKTLLWVAGVAVIVLLIACANVANLMLARALRRRRETAVRLALGVRRGRLIMQSLTESLMLALLGCIAGVAIAQWGGAALRKLFVRATTLEVLTDWRTLGVAAAAALAAGVVAGIGPAFLATTANDLAGGLKAGARDGTHQRSRLRSALLVTQAALSVILLVGAGLFVRSLHRVRDMRVGFDAEPVLIATTSMRGTVLDDSGRARLSRNLLETGQAIPGVAHAASVSSIPFWSTSGTDFTVPGIDSVRKLGDFSYQTGTPDYFATTGTRIVQGRGFTAEDRGGAPRVVVVSQAMANVLWPGRDALGQCMRFTRGNGSCTTVIGVAEDAVQRTLTDDDRRLHYYMPLDQHNPAGGHSLFLRLRGDAAEGVEPVRKALQLVMPGDAYVNVRPMANLVEDQRRSWKVGATMFVAFGVLALLVAAVGLYGVITYNVAQRMHELGIRIALGAQARDVLRLVVGQGVAFAALGVAIGLGVALLLARFVEPLLFQQPARDPVTYGAVGITLIVVALLASAVPAFRATRADPNTALRAE